MPRTAPGDGAPLPVSLTPLVGRAAEVAAVSALLRNPDVRLVTVTGPGGVGKTRLALHIAGLLADSFSLDVHIVALAALSEPDAVLPAIADSLALGELGDTVEPVHLARALGQRRRLLVLDNFEHVAGAAPIVAELLSFCSGLTVLATSRSPLHVRGEQEFPLGPLALPTPDETWSLPDLEHNPAVALYLQRARSVRPDFTLSAENATAVADVCVHLDGLPLAIELAAARARILSPQAMLSRLEHRFALLTGGALDLPPRLRTMRDAVAWSHDLLTADEQTLFRRLAVFAGGFTLEAAEHVGRETENGKRTIATRPPVSRFPSSDSVLDGIASLVEKSLVTQREGFDGEPRLGMLETIRQFGLELLAAAGETEATRDHHAAYFLALAEETAAGPDEADSDARFARLAPEHDNLRLALARYEQREDPEGGLRLTVALLTFWYWRSHRAEGYRWVERFLGMSGTIPPDLKARALFALGIFTTGERPDERAVPPFRESLALWRALGDELGTARALTLLGIKLKKLGAYAEAAPLLDEATTLFDRLGFNAQWALAHHHRGVVAYGQGDLAGAEAMIAEAVDRHRRASDAGAPIAWVAQALGDLGTVVRERGDLERAVGLLTESLEHWHGTGSREGVADVLVSLATIAATGQPEQAARLFGAAAGFADAVGYAFGLPEREAHERAEARLRKTMGDEAFAPAWGAGRDLSFDQAIAEALAVRASETEASDAVGTGTPGMTAGLSPREADVLRLLVAGASNREIAEQLFVSPRTVQTHLTNIFGKLGVATRAAAIAYAYQHSLV